MVKYSMELSPRMYRLFVRPKWVTKLYIRDTLNNMFDFNEKIIMDFGCGTGSCSQMFAPENYIGADCDYRRVLYARHLYPEYSFRALEDGNLPVPDSSIDYIVIISVLHHIPTQELKQYLEEFRRVLKNGGSIIAMEPCYRYNSHLCNYFMSVFDKGKYIRNEKGYLDIFNNCKYETEVLKRYNQLLFYNKLFFTAYPK